MVRCRRAALFGSKTRGGIPDSEGASLEQLGRTPGSTSVLGHYLGHWGYLRGTTHCFMLCCAKLRRFQDLTVLIEMRLENYAVIDNLVVEFGPGLNLLTGETGAGKSILVDALALLVGRQSFERRDPRRERSGPWFRRCLRRRVRRRNLWLEFWKPTDWTSRTTDR